MRKTLTNALVAAAALALPAGYAQAQMITGKGEGSFSNLSSCDYSGSHRDCRIVWTPNGDATQVQWGSTSSHTDFQNPSKLTSVDVTIDATAPVTGLEIGRLEWYNSATKRLDSSLDVFKVKWSLSVDFTSPTGSDPNGDELFSFTIKNPINPTGDTIFGFELADLSGLAASISLDGVVLSNFRYQVTDGDGAGSSWLGANWWYNDEYNHSRLSILADVTPITTPIPEPETYAMLLAGLALLGWRQRRRLQRA